MKKSDLNRFRQELLALRGRASGDLSILDVEASAGGPGSHMHADPADQSASTADAESNFHLMQNGQAVLGQIDLALARLEEGSYGVCEECQTSIPLERLRLLPYATRCIRCAAKQERS